MFLHNKINNKINFQEQEEVIWILYVHFMKGLIKTQSIPTSPTSEGDLNPVPDLDLNVVPGGSLLLSISSCSCDVSKGSIGCCLEMYIM